MTWLFVSGSTPQYPAHTTAIRYHMSFVTI